jgi:hypothetical protein
MALTGIADEFLRVLLAHEEGLPDEQVRNIFGSRYEQVAGAINELLAVNRLQLFTQNNSLVYKAIREETALKFEGLKYVKISTILEIYYDFLSRRPEDMLTYQAIERSGNK